LRFVTAIRDTRRPDALPDDATLGAEGNERLTAWTGTALLLGFAAEGLTILDVHWYLKWHLIIGYALLLPVGLKLASTGYRFARYYTGTPAYRRKGPPRPLLRVLGPVLVLLTVGVLATGVGLEVLPSSYHFRLEQLHKLSFIAWFGVTAVHVLAYVWRLPRLMIADLIVRGTRGSAAAQRIVLVVASGVLGLGLGFALYATVK